MFLRALSAVKSARVVAALVVVAGAVVLWLTTVGDGGDGRVTGDIIATLQRSGVVASSHMEFVLPGTETDFAPNAPVYRSNHVETDQSLTAALIQLTDKKQDGRASRDELYWLTVGFLAADLLDEASISAGEAVQLYPDDGDILTLAAVIRCLKGECADAEGLLREAIALDLRDEVARLDLAVVLMRVGNRDGARDLLQQVVSAEPETPLGDRARLLLR